MQWYASLLFCLVAASQLVACGRPEFVRTCDKREAYEEAIEHEKLKVPEGLDELDRLKELPLPEAAPAADRPEGSPCLDLPPGVTNQRRSEDG